MKICNWIITRYLLYVIYIISIEKNEKLVYLNIITSDKFSKKILQYIEWTHSPFDAKAAEIGTSSRRRVRAMKRDCFTNCKRNKLRTLSRSCWEGYIIKCAFSLHANRNTIMTSTKRTEIVRNLVFMNLYNSFYSD